MDRRFEVAKHLKRLRDDELDTLRHHFLPNIKVLEIGGGNGYQASKIASWGCTVYSIDLPNRENSAKYFAVADYNGRDFPFESEYFDVIFTSNVLEHVADTGQTMKEIWRVLKPSGKALCIMPTPAWRFWSILSHYPYALSSILRSIIKQQPFSIKGKGLIAPPHGEYQSSFHEIFSYSSRRWRVAFQDAQLKVIKQHKTGVFCTLYAIFPNADLRVRRFLATLLGSAGNIFIVSRN